MFSSNVDASAREVAIQLLARREYSRAELARKLQQKTFELIYSELQNDPQQMAVDAIEEWKKATKSL